MIKANSVDSVGQWKLLWAIGSGNPTSPPGDWLLKLSANTDFHHVTNTRETLSKDEEAVLCFCGF